VELLEGVVAAYRYAGIDTFVLMQDAYRARHYPCSVVHSMPSLTAAPPHRAAFHLIIRTFQQSARESQHTQHGQRSKLSVNSITGSCGVVQFCAMVHSYNPAKEEGRMERMGHQR